MICEIREGGREVVLHHPTLLDVLTMLTLLFMKDKEIVFTRPAEEDDMTDCKHEFVYDELHGEIVCKFCGYVLTADDKRELHRKAFELMEEEEGAD